MKKPNITVVIPTHKRADTLGSAIASVKSQQQVNCEIIVINGILDDRATDAVVNSFDEINYIKNSKYLDCSSKRALGLKLATSPYIMFLDDDDRLTDNLFLRKAKDILDREERVSFVAGDHTKRHEREDGGVAEITHHQFPDEGRLNGLEYFCQFQITKTKPQSTCTTVFRVKALTDGIGIVEVNDSAIYLKALLWGDSYHIRGEVAEYRVWKKSITGGGEGNDLRLKISTMVQKEIFLKEAIKRTDKALDWWFGTFKMNFAYFERSGHDRNELILMAVWGILHAHGAKGMIGHILWRLRAISPEYFGNIESGLDFQALAKRLSRAYLRAVRHNTTVYEPYYSQILREIVRVLHPYSYCLFSVLISLRRFALNFKGGVTCY